jgi:hypothetical protein
MGENTLAMKRNPVSSLPCFTIEKVYHELSPLWNIQTDEHAAPGVINRLLFREVALSVLLQFGGFKG